MTIPHYLNTERITIRRFIKSDEECFIKFMTDSRIVNNLALDDKSKTEQGAKDLLEATVRSYDKDLPLMAFAIEVKASKEFIGVCGLSPLNNFEIEVFYALFPDFWGKGIATEALKRLKEFIFTKTNYSTIKAYIKKGNDSSKKVALKNDFRDVGLVENKNFSDKVYLFSLTKE